MATSVLIVDDHAPFRGWAPRLLEQAGYAVLGEAADGAAAIDAARRTRPELVLLDIRLPEPTGKKELSGEALPLAVLVGHQRARAVYANPLAEQLLGDDLELRQTVP